MHWLRVTHFIYHLWLLLLLLLLYYYYYYYCV